MVRTLFEAVGLVGVVVLVFLQNWRAVLIPMIAVPVAIVGTFAVMAAVGFSLNNISLFGLVLAIGIVVDDAIVVVENVERWLEQGVSPRDAARKAMDEVSGPGHRRGPGAVRRVRAVRLHQRHHRPVLPPVRRDHRRLDRVLGLQLADAEPGAGGHPARRPHGQSGRARDPLTWLLDTMLGWFFRLFNRVFSAGTAAYAWVVGRLLRVSLLVLLAYGGLLVLTVRGVHAAPTGFVPQQDQGRVIAAVQLPDSASCGAPRRPWPRPNRSPHDTPAWRTRSPSRACRSCSRPTAPTSRTMFIVLDPFEKRQTRDLSADAIMARLREAWQPQIKDGMVRVFGAPPIPGLSVAGGFKLMVEDRAGLGAGRPCRSRPTP